jgi:hypothetical protein
MNETNETKLPGRKKESVGRILLLLGIIFGVLGVINVVVDLIVGKKLGIPNLAEFIWAGILILSGMKLSASPIGHSSASIRYSGEVLVVESQAERRVKYGVIVGATILIAILVAALVIYAAERQPKRVDTTAAGLFSLKQQTINIIKDNPQKITIISLYSKAKPTEVSEQAPDAPPPLSEAAAAERVEKINDLLEEYHDKGKNIEVESIDPLADPFKVDQLVSQVTEQYQPQVKKYRAFVGSEDGKEPGAYAASLNQIMALLSDQLDKREKLNTDEVKSEDLASDLNAVFLTVNQLVSSLKSEQARIHSALKEKPPLFKKAADDIKEHVDVVSSAAAALQELAAKYKVDKTVSSGIQKYFADAEPAFGSVKKQADALSKQAGELGELKLDTLTDALRQRNSILIRGETDWKVIPENQVWVIDRTQRRSGEGETPPPRFAGEQMISAAIFSLQHPRKLMVAFVRAGGEALAQPGMPPFSRPGPFADVAEALREYNYDVVEKDLTGMSQMQQQQMAAPEPTDEQIKDAVWVVVDVPAGQSQSQFGAPPTITPKVADHLNHGGSAVFLVDLQADDMSLALKDWGIEIQPNVCIIHEAIHSEGPRGSDIEEALKYPPLFPISEWGDSPVTAPLASLPGVLIYGVPVKTTPVANVKSWPILPVPQTLKTWGETDFQSLSNPNPVFNPGKDVAGPFYAGSVAEKKDMGRVVVIGSMRMPLSGVISVASENGSRALVFPGNRELFMDSIFWLSHQETMIAISPAAMDVSRVDHMSRTVQNVWRGGVLLVLLPALVIALGALVFIARRD